MIFFISFSTHLSLLIYLRTMSVRNSAKRKRRVSDYEITSDTSDDSEEDDSEEDEEDEDSPDHPIVVSVETQTETTSVETQTETTSVRNSTSLLDDLVTAALEAPRETAVVDLFHRLTSATEKLRPMYDSAMEKRDELIEEFLKKNEEYRCPISRGLMENPVMTVPLYGEDYQYSGQTYDRPQIERHILIMPDAPIDPMTNHRIRSELVKNLSLKQCIVRDLKRAKLDAFFKDTTARS